MAKYKDVEPILAKLEEFAKSTCDSSYEDGIRIATQVINETHTTDVQEVQHAHWDKLRYQMYECSRCKRSVYLEGLNVTDENEAKLLREIYPYCHCGAKMDEKEGK